VLAVPIILITGQWFLPQLEASQALEQVVDHPMVAHWFAQNPVLDHPKYTGIPYGIRPSSLSQYAAFLLRREASPTRQETRAVLATLPVTRGNSPARAALPEAARIPYDEFLQRVASAHYLVSPAGDRSDTYRHAEAIGLGTIPICDCPPQFSGVYGSSMLRARLSEGARVDGDGESGNLTILEMIQDPSHLRALPARRVQRERILASYWFGRILSKKAELERALARARESPSLPCWMLGRHNGETGTRADNGQPLFEGREAPRQSISLRLAPSLEAWFDEEILTQERRLVAGASGAHGASSSVDSRGASQAQAPAAVSSRAQGGGAGGEGRGREPDGKDLGCPCEEAFVKCRLSSRLYRDGILQGQVFSLRYFKERGGEERGAIERACVRLLLPCRSRDQLYASHNNTSRTFLW